MTAGPRTRFAAALVVMTACASTLSPGDVGTLRFAGRAKGLTPLAILPPVSDPAGNLYVLNGALAIPETHVFVGAAGGGWTATCNLTKGDQVGAHGWSGYAANRQWYWSGGALVAVSGTEGSCHAVLDRDPSTNADLTFQAVMPAVRNLSERTTVVAWVQSPTDPLPFSALVDLEAEFLTNVQEFQPGDASDVQVIGVGGVRERERGIVLVQYREGSQAFVELRGFNGNGDLVDRVQVAGGPFAKYAIQGYLQLDDGNLVAGLIATSDPDSPVQLLTADGGGGDLVPVTAMTPMGVHRWQGSLWLVGLLNNAPVVAKIARGGIGVVQPWGASTATANGFGASTTVRDDRSLPSRETTWTNVKTAAGAFPFLSAHSLTEHAPDTTLWVFAGPADTESTLKLTSFAVAPVGVTYP